MIKHDRYKLQQIVSTDGKNLLNKKKTFIKQDHGQHNIGEFASIVRVDKLLYLAKDKKIAKLTANLY